MKKLSENIILYFIIAILLISLGGFYIDKQNYISQQKSKWGIEDNLTDEEAYQEYLKIVNKSNESVEIKEQQKKADEKDKFVEVAINKLGNEYCINIQKGGESYCIWRYSAGNGNIPHIELTKAKTLNEKHHLVLYDSFWDFSVYCFDDWGNNYVGNLDKE